MKSQVVQCEAACAKERAKIDINTIHQLIMHTRQTVNAGMSHMKTSFMPMEKKNLLEEKGRGRKQIINTSQKC